MSLLRTHESKGDLPADIQASVQKYTNKENKSVKKDLHSAVTALDRSREDLEAAISARSNLHSSWRTFLTDSLARFQTYGQDFAKQEKDMLERIEHATQVFQAAKERLSAAKDIATKDPQGAQYISDEEGGPPDVPMVNPDRIAACLSTLTTSLEGLKSQADELAKEEQKNKRPRLSGPADTEVMDGDVSKSAPFT